eukprot:365012-Chlamydomonas_euryale.AAC.10
MGFAEHAWSPSMQHVCRAHTAAMHARSHLVRRMRCSHHVVGNPHALDRPRRRNGLRFRRLQRSVRRPQCTHRLLSPVW